MEIGNVVKGNASKLVGADVDLPAARKEICKKCLIYSREGLCNNKLYLNPETNDVAVEPAEGYVRGCGCVIDVKTKNPTSHCPAKKW
jgi:hypothetical protein